MHNSSQYQSVIQALNACAATCDHCYSACLQEQDVKMMVRCIQLDRDCAEICKLTASALARGSEVARTLLQACADICKACGDECAQHTHMGHCQECAEACRRCEEACRSAV
ncbi:four-helix bundle copper-binding protein [Adhaeribacter aquaticus]|uniref:four-helix bundle copper-binding protein n=1 Tax=Adhaeribacter aquaticus TaxID=299567 RepID=UPI00040F5C0C|nr:four-helix bundle copper-binding protein [Adhaeribacter aquaticus]